MKKIIRVFFMLLFLLCTNNVYAQSEIKDFLGRDLKINKHVSRILSLTPATTEILYKLGLE
ncbi:MAG: ABC transporter substrate-binding protein, partial [Candidatus Sericytochromatia bacterium]|nr:ABC transporter substrate-binding protein [Candidatus Sericytochromatia bacterium]